MELSDQSIIEVWVLSSVLFKISRYQLVAHVRWVLSKAFDVMSIYQHYAVHSPYKRCCLSLFQQCRMWCEALTTYCRVVWGFRFLEDISFQQLVWKFWGGYLGIHCVVSWTDSGICKGVLLCWRTKVRPAMGWPSNESRDWKYCVCPNSSDRPTVQHRKSLTIKTELSVSPYKYGFEVLPFQQQVNNSLMSP